MKNYKRQKELIIDALIRCDSYERFPTFLEMSDEMELKGELYWFALRECYSCCDNQYQFRNEIKTAFRRTDPHRDILMSKKEIKYLKNLPETFPIYRGMTIDEYESGNFGVSWSLKESVAKFFAEKYRRNFDTEDLPKTVHQLTIKKDDVIAYFGERKEYEIICLHK